MRRSGCESEARGGPSRSASNTASGCTAVSSGVQLYRSEWFHGFQNCRVISTGSQILERLGIKKIRLMSGQCILMHCPVSILKSRSACSREPRRRAHALQARPLWASTGRSFHAEFPERFDHVCKKADQSSRSVNRVW